MGPPNPVKFETLCNDQNDHSADAEDKHHHQKKNKVIIENWVQSVTKLTGCHK